MSNRRRPRECSNVRKQVALENTLYTILEKLDIYLRWRYMPSLNSSLKNETQARVAGVRERDAARHFGGGSARSAATGRGSARLHGRGGVDAVERRARARGRGRETRGLRDASLRRPSTHAISMFGFSLVFESGRDECRYCGVTKWRVLLQEPRDPCALESALELSRWSFFIGHT